MKKIFTLILLITCVISVKAYENEYFEINIPDGYNAEISDKVYKWTKENDYIAITVSDNINKYNFAKYNDTDLEKQKKHLIDTYTEELKEYDCTVEVSDLVKEEINDFTIITYDINWNSEKVIGYNTYQKSATYSTNNYIYTITQSSDKEINNDDFKKLINEFKPLDTSGDSNHLIGIIIVLGTIGGIIGYLIKSKINKEHK